MTREEQIQFIAGLSHMALLTYVPLWAHQLGLSDPEVALVAIVYGMIILSSNIIAGRLSDLIGSRKLFIILGLAFSFPSVLLLIFPREALSFLVIRGLTGIGLGMFFPSLNALVSEKQQLLGRFSSIGSLGFTSGLLISGFIGIVWIEGIFVFSSLSLLGAAVIALYVKEDHSPVKKYKDSVIRIFLQRKSVYFAFMIRHSLAVSIWTFWPIFLVSLGADTFWIAIIQITNTFTQVIIMQLLTDKIKSETMVALGLLLTSITFMLFTIPQNFVGFIPTQIVLGTSWAFLFVGTLRYAIEYSDFDKSTASGLFGSIQSISFIFGSILALIITLLGGDYLAIIIIASIGTFVLFLIYTGTEFYHSRQTSSPMYSGS